MSASLSSRGEDKQPWDGGEMGVARDETRPALHGAILHLPAVTGNEKLPQKGTKIHKTECTGKISFRVFCGYGFHTPRISRKERRFPRAAPVADR
jgi:hypothetical protein